MLRITRAGKSDTGECSSAPKSARKRYETQVSPFRDCLFPCAFVLFNVAVSCFSKFLVGDASEIGTVIANDIVYPGMTRSPYENYPHPLAFPKTMTIIWGKGSLVLHWRGGTRI